MREVQVGDVYEGVGDSKGLRVRVLEIVPESDNFVGKARVALTPADSALPSCQAAIDYYRRFDPAYAERLHALCTETREEWRELLWFEMWLKGGFIRRVSP